MGCQQVDMVKRLISFTILLIGLYLIINLTRDISRLLRAKDSVALVEKKVEKLQEEQGRLLELKEYYSSPEFIEKEAREKLGMAKPGETIIILPTNLPQVLGRSEDREEPTIPNWRKWWELFF